jgi:CTP synthase (UTP-ammonia lyase)
MPDSLVGLIGDYDPQVVAHQAIPLALQLASEDFDNPVSFTWLPTETLTTLSETSLRDYAGFWCVPGKRWDISHDSPWREYLEYLESSIG